MYAIECQYKSNGITKRVWTGDFTSCLNWMIDHLDSEFLKPFKTWELKELSIKTKRLPIQSLRLQDWKDFRI